MRGNEILVSKNDLMVGDVVACAIIANAMMVPECLVARIVTIEEDGCRVRYEYNNRTNITFVKYQSILPIEIADDNLQKNGFNVSVVSFVMKDNADEEIFTALKHNERWWIPVSYYGGNGRYLTYVHELQNALRMCGLNDIADNYKVEHEE